MRSCITNERGAVLVTGLLFLSILTILGTSAYLTTSSEIDMSRNFRIAKAAFYQAEAGIAEARFRMKGDVSDANFIGDPVSGYDNKWAAYIVTDEYLADNAAWTPGTGLDDAEFGDGTYKKYIPTQATPPVQTSTAVSNNAVYSSLSYWSIIRHKTEFDAEEDGHTATNKLYYDEDGTTYTPGTAHNRTTPGNIIFYGYTAATGTTAVQFTGSYTDTVGAGYYPVEIIATYTSVKGGKAVNKVETVRPPPPYINSALYAKGNVTVNGGGGNVVVSGNDNCGSATAKSPIYTYSPSTTTSNGTPSYTPTTPTSGSEDIDVVETYDNLLSVASSTIPLSAGVHTNDDFGDAANFVTVHFAGPGQVTLKNCTGYGTLLVNGDLSMGASFQWNGLIIVTGGITFSGGGSGANITGAVLSNGFSAINGSIEIKYDSCMVSTSVSGSALTVLSWKQVHD